jgi:hypothetical protein
MCIALSRKAVGALEVTPVHGFDQPLNGVGRPRQRPGADDSPHCNEGDRWAPSSRSYGPAWSGTSSREGPARRCSGPCPHASARSRGAPRPRQSRRHTRSGDGGVVQLSEFLEGADVDGALALRFWVEDGVEHLGFGDVRPLRRVMSILRQCSRMKVPYLARVRVGCVVQEDHRQLVSTEQYRVLVMLSCGKVSAEVIDASL